MAARLSAAELWRPSVRRFCRRVERLLLSRRLTPARAAMVLAQLVKCDHGPALIVAFELVEDLLCVFPRPPDAKWATTEGFREMFRVALAN